MLSALLLASVVSLGSATVHATGVSLLRERPLFEPPLANPRSPDFGFGVRLDRFDRYAADLGARLPIVSYHFAPDTALQVGIDAGSWAVLGRTDGLLFPLHSADYLLGLPVMARWHNYSAVLSFAHISAHLGDGSKHRTRINYSREFFTLRLAATFEPAGFRLRTYVGGGFIVHTEPKDVGRASAGLGLEATAPPWLEALRGYGALDVTWNQDTHSVDVAGQLGVKLFPDADDLLHFRLALVGYSGSDRRGQYLGSYRRSLSLAVLAQL